VKVWAHMSLADLLRLDGSSALQEEWTAQVRGQWAAHRAQASETGGDGGAWLDGGAAKAIACDAAMAPVVTGDVNAAALEDLVRLCTELGQLRHADPAAAGPDAGSAPGTSSPDTGLARAALEQAIIGKAVDLLRPRRPGRLPAPPPARRPPRRAQPALGHRLRRDHPGGHPQRGHAAGPALPLGRRVLPARRGL